MKNPFRPYRRTTTITFHNCRNRQLLVSPKRIADMYPIAEGFIGRLKAAGFDVTETEVLPKGYRLWCALSKLSVEVGFGALWSSWRNVVHHDHSFRRFEPHTVAGYTMGAILAGSDASVHTYPEADYGATYELELNLCYLWLEMELKHRQAVDRVTALFSSWLDPALTPDIEEPEPRYFQRLNITA